MEGVAMRKNPQLLQQKIAGIEASKMAEMAEQIYGSRGTPANYQQQFQEESGPMQPGQARGYQRVNVLNPGENERSEAIQGTGMFDESISPDQRHMLMNKRMLGSGVKGFNDQWAKNQGNMQAQNMTGMNSMARQIQQQRYDTANPTQSAMMKNVQAGGFTPGTPAYQAEINKQRRKPGMTVNTGSVGRRDNIVSQEDKDRLGLTGNYVWDKNNMPKAISPSAFSDAQNKVAGYGTMMEKAEENLAELASTGHEAPTRLMSAMKLVDPSSGLADFIKGYGGSEQDQRYLQAMEQWVRAKLRKESGAVISVEEAVNEYGTYFPTVNEAAGATKQKRQARLDALSTYEKESGGSYKFNSDKWNQPATTKPRYSDPAKQARYEKFKAEQSK